MSQKDGVGSAQADRIRCVLTAQMSRQVTIATTFITGLVGIAGTITAARLSSDSASKQIVSARESLLVQIDHENAKSSFEFLRGQRQPAYTDFGNAANSTLRTMDDILHLFQGGRHPTVSEYESDVTKFTDGLAKVDDTFSRMSIVASGPARFENRSRHRNTPGAHRTRRLRVTA